MNILEWGEKYNENLSKHLSLKYAALEKIKERKIVLVNELNTLLNSELIVNLKFTNLYNREIKDSSEAITIYSDSSTKKVKVHLADRYQDLDLKTLALATHLLTEISAHEEEVYPLVKELSHLCFSDYSNFLEGDIKQYFHNIINEFNSIVKEPNMYAKIKHCSFLKTTTHEKTARDEAGQKIRVQVPGLEGRRIEVWGRKNVNWEQYRTSGNYTYYTYKDSSYYKDHYTFIQECINEEYRFVNINLENMDFDKAESVILLNF